MVRLLPPSPPLVPLQPPLPRLLPLLLQGSLAPLLLAPPLSQTRPQVLCVLPSGQLEQYVLKLLNHLHPVENQVVGLAQTLQEVVELLPLHAAIVVVALAEAKVDLGEKKKGLMNNSTKPMFTLELPWSHLLMS